MMGYITSAGSVGRILMPPITEAVGTDGAYGLSIALCAISSICIFVYGWFVKTFRERAIKQEAEGGNIQEDA